MESLENLSSNSPQRVFGSSNHRFDALSRRGSGVIRGPSSIIRPHAKDDEFIKALILQRDDDTLTASVEVG